jgi:hypothetical protein
VLTDTKQEINKLGVVITALDTCPCTTSSLPNSSVGLALPNGSVGLALPNSSVGLALPNGSVGLALPNGSVGLVYSGC